MGRNEGIPLTYTYTANGSPENINYIRSRIEQFCPESDDRDKIVNNAVNTTTNHGDWVGEGLGANSGKNGQLGGNSLLRFTHTPKVAEILNTPALLGRKYPNDNDYAPGHEDRGKKQSPHSTYGCKYFCGDE